MKKRPQMLGRSQGYPGPQVIALAAVMTVLSTMACAPSANSLGKSLAFASFEFNDGVRWRKYQQAAKRLSPKIRDAYLDHAEKTDEKVNVSEIDLLRTKIDVQKKTAELRFRFIWHLTSRGIVRKAVLVEHWKQIKDVWFVMKIQHVSGKDEFPLFVGLTPEEQEKKKKEKAKKDKKRARPQPPSKARH